VTAPSVPAGEGDDPRGLSPSPFEASEGRAGLPQGAAPPLVLSGAERTREALLASAIAVEFIRVVALSDSAHPSDSRVAARYTSQVVDNSRALAGSDAALHLSFLRGHLVWLRGLPSGGGLR
jgi:hypothetical protein